jgi:hypothetical protein
VEVLSGSGKTSAAVNGEGNPRDRLYETTKVNTLKPAPTTWPSVKNSPRDAGERELLCKRCWGATVVLVVLGPGRLSLDACGPARAL